MGSVTEQEAREAAKSMQFLKDAATSHELSILAKWAVVELDRRDAERAERAKPIDAEWLESLGAVRENNPAGGHWQWSIGLVRIAKLRGGWQWWIGMFHGEQLVKAETREDILRLIEALKGGAT